MGLQILRNIRYAKALESFDKAILIDPDISDAWYYKGQALYNLHRYSESISDFNTVNDFDPLNSDAWYYKGQALYNLQRYSEAIDAFDKVLNITKDNSEALTLRGNHFTNKEDSKKQLSPLINLRKLLQKMIKPYHDYMKFMLIYF